MSDIVADLQAKVAWLIVRNAERDAREAEILARLARAERELALPPVRAYLERQRRREAVTNRKYRLICEFAAVIGSGSPTAVHRAIERAWRGAAPPDRAEIIEQLRVCCDRGGPAPKTVERALLSPFSPFG